MSTNEHPVSGVVFENAVAKNTVDQLLFGVVGLEVDARGWPCALGARKDAILHQQVFYIGDADALPMIVLRNAVADDDVFAASSRARADVYAIAAAALDS